jgi:pantetheine-phosphate adenylyltransferase
MSAPRLAVVPGSFDPITLGHVDLVERAGRLFDRVVVAVLTNASKRPFLAAEERVQLVRAACPGVEVEAVSGLLADYVVRRGAIAVVRGVRGGSDFDYERQMGFMNRQLAAGLETVCLLPSQGLAHISSTLVREIALAGGPVGGLVPPAVERALAGRRRSDDLRAV